jgi:transcriptional regulator GlxA family with amidase domain
MEWFPRTCGLLIIAISLQLQTAEAAEPAKRDVSGEKSKPMIRTVAVLLFEGVELMDFAGPAEVFIVADEGKAFRVVTVANSTKPLKTMGGITVTPDYDFSTAPKAEVLVIPGGNMQAVNQAGREWIKSAAKDAEIVMSVCFGAMLLADSGLLDGVEATTHHWGIERLRKLAPKCKVVESKRYVDSGKVITTAGVTAGIDGALHIVERMLGKEAARWTAVEWMEHPVK